MKFQINHRITGAVLFELECGTLRLCVEAAVKARADLAGANLADANLADANLAGAYLAGAYLARAYLAGANLARANLADANLARANLAGANLAGAINSELAFAMTRILPEGDLIGWKKAGTCIVKLRIPADAPRSSAFGRKCRAAFADVLEVIGNPADAFTDAHGPRTVYTVGQRVTADRWCENWQAECSHGIHFFITRAEAEAY